MSGIFGVVRQPGAQVTAAELDSMADALKHRGPDGIHYVAKDSVGLGHCMLQSTPESLHEVLPYQHEAAGLTITADARIDYRDELMAKLGVSEINGLVITDSQLILNAFIKWGENCVDHLVGDFAFAIWDEKQQSVFLARDHMGIRPLYYYFSRGLLVFASSAQAVARADAVETRIYAPRIVDFLIEELEGIDKTTTFFENISRLPPATSLRIRNGTLVSRRYWEPRSTTPLDLDSDEAYQEVFSSIYRDAVAERLRCQRPVVSMLSGGLDSSTVVALSRNIHRERGLPELQTVSAMSVDEHCPEAIAINATLGQGGLRSTVLDAHSAATMKDDFLAATHLLEDPFDCFQAVPALMYMQSAKAGGRVVLDGVDGDSVTGINYGYHTQLVRQGKWLTAWREAREFSQHAYCGEVSAGRIFIGALWGGLAPEPIKRLRHRTRRRSVNAELLDGKFVDPEFARQAGLADRLEQYHALCRVPATADVAAAHTHRLESPFLTCALERYERVGSYFGIEPRHPLMDKRLVELCLAFPREQKVRNGWMKFQLRMLADSMLPTEIAWAEGRRHVGWEISQHLIGESWAWLQAQREQIVSVRPEFLDIGLLSIYKSDMTNSEDEYFRARCWRLYCLVNWMKRAKLDIGANK